MQLSCRLQNNIEELFQLLAFLDPVKFGGGMQDMDSTYGHLAEAKQARSLTWQHLTVIRVLPAIVPITF